MNPTEVVNDQWTIRAVVIGVSVIVCVALVALAVLAYQGKDAPEVLGNIVLAGAAGLIGILASIKVNAAGQPIAQQPPPADQGGNVN